MPLRVLFFGTPGFAVPSLLAVIRSPHTVVGVITQPDRPRGRGQRVQIEAVKQAALEHRRPVWQPQRLRGPGVSRRDAGARAGRRRRGGVRTAAAAGGPRSAAARIDQRACVALAAMARRGAGASGHSGGRRRHRRHDHARGARARRRSPAGAGRHPNRPGRDEQPARSTARRHRCVARSALCSRTSSTGAPERSRRTTARRRTRRSSSARTVTSTGRTPAATVHNRIRGLHPWPHAAASLGGQRLLLIRSAIATPESTGAEPGTILQAARDDLVVATQPGAVRLVEVQPEGRRLMSTRDYLNGAHVAVGDRFQ